MSKVAKNRTVEELSLFASAPTTATVDARPQLTNGLIYRVVVECDGERDQAELIKRLEAEGIRCRPLIS